MRFGRKDQQVQSPEPGRRTWERTERAGALGTEVVVPDVSGGGVGRGNPVECGLLAERSRCCRKLGARETSAPWDRSRAGLCPATQEVLGKY